jgi:hypothetical protein
MNILIINDWKSCSRKRHAKESRNGRISKPRLPTYKMERSMISLSYAVSIWKHSSPYQLKVSNKVKSQVKMQKPGSNRMLIL